MENLKQKCKYITGGKKVYGITYTGINTVIFYTRARTVLYRTIFKGAFIVHSCSNLRISLINDLRNNHPIPDNMDLQYV